MNQSIFIIDLPIIAKAQPASTTPKGFRSNQADENGLFFMHGNGCGRWHNCLSCPFPECTWQPYPKKRINK